LKCLQIVLQWYTIIPEFFENFKLIRRGCFRSGGKTWLTRYYNFSTTRTRLFLRPDDPYIISKKIFFYDHYLQTQQKCIISADGFIVLELSSKYANSRFSEKDLMLFFSFQFINDTLICREISLAADCWLEFWAFHLRWTFYS
jgi:hypothetical protein